MHVRRSLPLILLFFTKIDLLYGRLLLLYPLFYCNFHILVFFKHYLRALRKIYIHCPHFVYILIAPRKWKTIYISRSWKWYSFKIGDKSIHLSWIIWVFLVNTLYVINLDENYTTLSDWRFNVESNNIEWNFSYYQVILNHTHTRYYKSAMVKRWKKTFSI